MRGLAEGTMIDERYRVLSRIGSGGMADVYCCEDLQLGRKIAVKLLHERFAQDAEFVERFRREASSAASLSHPNVVSVFDRGEWDGTYYIAMEYLGGRSLKALVREDGPLDSAHAIAVGAQVLRAARFAHQRGVVHRDLKPHNVIVDDEGRVKVTDFGIARAGASEITQTGSIMGTAQYLSPEQARGESVGPRSDLYSIGILLYELLTGRVPFEGDSAVTIALKQISEPPLPPSALNPAVSAELDAIVLRALAKDPVDRYADADEFLAALDGERERLRTGEHDFPPEQEALYLDERNPAGEPFSPRARRVLWPWVLAAAVLLAALVAAGLLLLGGAATRHVPDVIGQSEANATSTLQSAGFTVAPARIADAAPQGSVIREMPRGGASADKGSVVRIVVSNGPGAVQVPDVTGRGRAVARRILIKAGFRVSESELPSSTVAKDRVIMTSPPVGSALMSGASVALVISSGPQRIAVPGVVGKTQDDARTVLEAAGLKVAPTSQVSDKPPGTVLAQNPGAGASVAQGTVVVLTVAKASARVAVPAVVGQTTIAALNALTAAGLRASTTNRPVSDPAQDGVVLAQSPPAGTMRTRGAAVRLVLGRLSTPTTPTTPTTTTPTTPATKP